MISQEDVAEILLDALKEQPEIPKEPVRIPEREAERKGKWGFHVREPVNRPYQSLAAKRVFLSEYEIKSILKNGQKKIALPKSAIVSPLAQEWLQSKGIDIVFE